MDIEKQNSEVSQLMQQIRSYLELHPNAADSLEGIEHWWLVQTSKKNNNEAIKVAIERLVAEGYLTVSKAVQGVVYRRS